MQGASHIKWMWAALPEMYNGIIQLRHHSIKAVTKGFLESVLGFPDARSIMWPLKSKTLTPGSGLRETSYVCSLSMCVWHLSKSIRRFPHSIPAAPDWNQDTCKDLKANPLSNMHAGCGSSVTSWRYTLDSYLRQRKRSRLPTVCRPHDALTVRRCARGTVEAVHSHKQLLVKNLYWSIQHYYLQHVCTK